MSQSSQQTNAVGDSHSALLEAAERLYGPGLRSAPVGQDHSLRQRSNTNGRMDG